MVLILGGVFDGRDPGFAGATPSAYYVAAYFGVVLAAVGFIMLPVHLASYRERGLGIGPSSGGRPIVLAAMCAASTVAWIHVANRGSLHGTCLDCHGNDNVWRINNNQRSARSVAHVVRAETLHVRLGSRHPESRSADGKLDNDVIAITNSMRTLAPNASS